ncbi:MAG: alpha-isopropylmalate synthase regulatory domain-containing protein [Candidatus Pelethousia sp.]|nr:alpha-isopropylmalate synthase regulatory domain-containing protein [Candidatus Pelethousia sp.]
MRKIEIVDITLRVSGQLSASGLSFKEKLEIAKLLEKLRVDVIETGYIGDAPADQAAIRTIADTISESVVSVPVGLLEADIRRAAGALSRAKHPRLNLTVPTSTVQMEYAYQLKPEGLLRAVKESLTLCAALCGDVEFTAEDAARSEPAFLAQMVEAALSAGAKTITLCDSAGQLLPGEAAELIRTLEAAVPALSQARLCVQLQDGLGLATANALACAAAGVAAFKTTFNGLGACLSMEEFLQAVSRRGDALGIRSGVDTTQCQRACKHMEALLGMNRTGRSAFSRVIGTAEPEGNRDKEPITAESDAYTLRRRIEKLGYDLDEEDLKRVAQRVRLLAEKKKVDDRDLEALVAELTRHVTPTYQLVRYTINSGNSILATASIQLEKQGQAMQAVSVGDGPIDASFLALEQMLGHHFELEDFHIQAVTEGREAMGDALVKLRHEGRIYPGRGLSTDIIGASIQAYLHAVNKIVHEERTV